MAHFAKVLDGKVLNVIVAEPEFFDEFIDDSPGEYIQTSYNTAGGIHYDPETGDPSADQTKSLRKNFAVPGGSYDAENDAFYDIQPYPSWTLNTTSYLWEAPVALPEAGEGEEYDWDEETETWVNDPNNNI